MEERGFLQLRIGFPIRFEICCGKRVDFIDGISVTVNEYEEGEIRVTLILTRFKRPLWTKERLETVVT